MRIVFMGTPEFAVPTLDRLISDGHELCGVFTRQDKPKGRGMKLSVSPVKEYALSRGISVYQPASLKDEKAYEALKAIEPECIVVVAYGCILPKNILILPKYGCINLHASLLPKYRGAAPIQRTVINGERLTGVTAMHMSEGLDEGDIIFSEEYEIKPADTAGIVHDALMTMGASLISRTIKAIEAGCTPRTVQDNSIASFAPKILKSEARIDWKEPAERIYNLVRGLNPWPAAYTELNGKIVKIHETKVESGISEAPAGTVFCAGQDSGLIIVCGGGSLLCILEMTEEGGRRMTSGEYLRGHPVMKGQLL